MTYQNTQLICHLPHLRELNIGHSIISRSIIVGVGQAVREMRDLINHQELRLGSGGLGTSEDIIIEYSPHEIRVATLEGDALTNFIMRDLKRSGLLGIFTKAAWRRFYQEWSPLFVDIGEERSAFFYIDDILPESLENEVAKASEGKIPIDKLLSEGQDVIVQEYKGPISTRARIWLMFPYQAGIWFTCPFRTPWECQGRLQTIPSEYG